MADDACAPICADCGEDAFSAPAYDENFLQSLRSFTLINPLEPLQENPYSNTTRAEALQNVQPGQVCAVHLEGNNARSYRLQTWPSASEAIEGGGIVTHEGACGLCSDLESLAVYAGVGDLTAPVRDCGVEGLFLGEEANLQCLQEIGFNDACASIWYWNTVNTREKCQKICIELLNAPYHTPDGSLNACLQCDEDESGPVFKAVAGRTRRNSGLATALCRPCSEVLALEHLYE